jgi:hypothetical protein
MTENGKLANPETPEGGLDRVKFDYIKSNFFRVVHADGVFGGITPRLDIQMDVWSERQAIPKEVVHELRPDGTLGEEMREERVVRDAIVREVEVGVVIDVGLAKSMINWLQEKIERIEEAQRKRRDEDEGVE